jgi:hypothetical protein
MSSFHRNMLWFDLEKAQRAEIACCACIRRPRGGGGGDVAADGETNPLVEKLFRKMTQAKQTAGARIAGGFTSCAKIDESAGCSRRRLIKRPVA